MTVTTLTRTPRKHQIPPRAEAWIRYINDSLLRNVSLGEDATSVILPPLVERAYMLLNETTPLDTELYPEGTPFRRRQ
ncbi:MAG: hypothetical protein DRP01_00245 [Archaeoglobales archaeon]|nr:MAG: hypothetical protein DRP01_00245 [Archaeoglobales archaeon]